jgi:hypothetical protein
MLLNHLQGGIGEPELKIRRPCPMMSPIASCGWPTVPGTP